jgi:hypothetical protein
MKCFVIKLLLFITLSFYSQESFGQQINGVYKSDFNMFQNFNNSSKNFTSHIENLIVVEIYDSPYTRGYVSVISNVEGEMITVKFIVQGSKSYIYEDGNTYLVYDAVVSLLGVETSTKCKIAFEVNLDTFNVLYSNESIQLWNLSEKIY